MTGQDINDILSWVYANVENDDPCRSAYAKILLRLEEADRLKNYAGVSPESFLYDIKRSLDKGTSVARQEAAAHLGQCRRERVAESGIAVLQDKVLLMKKADAWDRLIDNVHDLPKNDLVNYLVDMDETILEESTTD